MKKIVIPIIFAMCFVPTSAMTAEKQLSPTLIFEIGGKAKIKKRRNRMIPVGGRLSWNNNLMCGDFDMSLSVTNLLNGVTDQLEKLADDLVQSVTGVISSWPMMEIARADPQLYEFLQQGKLEASDIFNASIASCESMTEKIIRGDKDATSTWIEISGYEDWMDGANKQNAKNNDVVQLEDKIDKNKGDSGVTWVGGEKKGGKNQPAIEIEKDTIRAGYNQLANRDVQSKALLPASETTPWYVEYWETPIKAEDWITSIIGTTTLRTCQKCDRLHTKPGKGVYAILEEDQRKIELEMLKFVDAPIVLYNEEQLASISAPGYPITQQIMEALKAESIYKETLIERLAEEIATTSIVERLIAARRLLIAGKSEANIAQAVDAVKIINKKIDELGEEMTLLRQDAELRALTKTSVAVTILERKYQREQFKTSISTNDHSEAIRKMTGRYKQ